MWGMTGRVRCRHGFPSEICPSCAGLGESNPLVSVEAKALNKLSERYAKALAVVDAARRVEATYSAFDPNYFSDQGRAVARAGLRAALAAFDEVADK